MDVPIRAPEMRQEQKTGTSLRNRKAPNPLVFTEKNKWSIRPFNTRVISLYSVIISSIYAGFMGLME